NSSFNQALTDTLYAGIEWDYNQTIAANAYTDSQDTLYNNSIADYVDTQIGALSFNMDYTNVAMTNISNAFAEEQNFSNGIRTDDVQALTGVAITFKAGV